MRFWSSWQRETSRNFNQTFDELLQDAEVAARAIGELVVQKRTAIDAGSL